MKAVADYVHSKGLKFGMYSDAGVKTWRGQAGQLRLSRSRTPNSSPSGRSTSSSSTYCYAAGGLARRPSSFTTAMGGELRATGRKILFSVCEWGQRQPVAVGGAGGRAYMADLIRRGQQVRTRHTTAPRHRHPHTAIDRMAGAGKIRRSGRNGTTRNMLTSASNPTTTSASARPANEHEQRTQFSMWCCLPRPLMIGCDIRDMSQVTRQSCSNVEAIAVNQDRVGKQGACASRLGRWKCGKKTAHRRPHCRGAPELARAGKQRKTRRIAH